MRYIALTALLCSLTFATMAQAEKKFSAQEQEIKTLSNEWMQATKNRDEKALNKIVAPEFKLGGTDASKPEVNREIWMKNTLENLKIDSASYSKVQIDVVDNVAIMRSTFYWSFSFRGMPVKTDTADLVDTWLKRDGAWQVVSRLMVDK